MNDIYGFVVQKIVKTEKLGVHYLQPIYSPGSSNNLNKKIITFEIYGEL